MVSVLAPRAGSVGVIATLLRLGVAIIDVVTGAGSFVKYNVGPAWTGAEFQTIQAAVDAAVADGHSTSTVGTNVLISLYPVRYTENVVVPSTLPRWVMASRQVAGLGAQINGTVNVTLPSTSANVVFDEIGFLGNVAISQPVVTGNVSVQFGGCSQFTGTMSVTQAAHASLGIGLTLNDHESNNTQTFSVRAFRWNGGTHGITTPAPVSITASGAAVVNFVAPMNLGAGALTFTNQAGGSMSAQTRFSELFSTVAPAVVQNCVSANFLQNRVYSPGPAIQDATSNFFELSGNRFHRNGGSALCVNSIGASALSPGGNSFEDGYTYPFIVKSAGSLATSEIADRLRSVTTLAGSPVLTPAEVGGQRKTTIAKVDGGGAVTLPLAAQVESGCTIVVKDLNGSATASPFTIVPQGGDLIDGGAVPSISTDYGAVTLQQMSATDWGVIGQYP